MKAKSLLLILLSFTLTSCKDDNNTSKEKSETVAWIEKTMRQNYYWYNEIPSESRLNYGADEKTFFKSLLTTKDGKTRSDGTHYYYSTISELTKTTKSISDVDNSYGFDYMFCSFQNSNTINALILYVVDDSPAQVAGLMRGDCIIAVNGANLTKSNYSSALSGEAIEVTFIRWEMPVTGERQISFLTANLGAARAVEDDPVHIADIIPYGGKNVGYMVYNHFTDGTDSEKDKYNNRLRDESKYFREGNLDAFVLDLRYNNGGLISCAQLLCAILGPEVVLDEVLGYLEYNDKQKPAKDAFKATKTMLGSGFNLGLSTLYVLTTQSTASASELVINCLRPHMNVVVIGETTEGKNVGSVTYTNDSKTWEMHPIICKVSNSNGYSDYAAGLAPDYPVSELSAIKDVPGVDVTLDLSVFRPFGDYDDALLDAALQVITTGKYVDPRTRKASTAGAPKVIYNSLDRKASSVIIGTNR